MITLALALLSQAGQIDEAGQRTTVVATAHPPDAVLAKLDGVSRETVASIYGELGFQSVIRGNHTYLFAPDVWQQKEIDTTLGALKELAQKMDGKGLVTAGDVPEVTQFADFAFEAMHAEIDTSSVLQLGLTRTATMSHGGKTLSIQLGGKQDADVDNKMRSNPLRSQTAEEARRPHDSKGSVVEPLVYLYLADFGQGYSEQSTRAQDLSSAMALLAEHFKDFDAKKSALKAKLTSDLLGHPPDELRNGAVGDLDPADQASLQVKFAQEWSRLGFADQNEASTFLSNCTLSTSSSLEIFGYSGNAHLGFGFL